jgi:hypothetical protein
MKNKTILRHLPLIYSSEQQMPLSRSKSSRHLNKAQYKFLTLLYIVEDILNPEGEDYILKKT